MPGIKFLQPIANRVVDTYFREGLDALPPDDRVFFLIWCYGPCIDNGGHASLFDNSQMDNYEATVVALREVGLFRHAELLVSAARALFGDTPVPRTLDERNEVIDQLAADSSEIDAALESCDRQFSTLGAADAVLDALEIWYLARA